MAHKIKSKSVKETISYNPALDQFEGIDMFPQKSALIAEKFKNRSISIEIEKVDVKKTPKKA